MLGHHTPYSSDAGIENDEGWNGGDESADEEIADDAEVDEAFLR